MTGPRRSAFGTVLPCLLILSAGMLYLARSPFSWVGEVNDDAQYILLAKSLLHGTYRQLQTPGAPIYTVAPPGFPIVLAPFVWLVHGHWPLLKGIPIVMTLFAGVLLWILTGAWLTVRARLFALFLFLFSPFVVYQSAMVMSEPLFLIFLLASLLQLHRLLGRRNDSDAWLLGALLGMAALTRSIGFVLIPVFMAALFAAGRKKELIVVGLLSAGLGGLFLIRNVLISSSASFYASAWMASWSDLAQLHRFADNLNRVTNLFFVAGLLGVPLPYSPMGILASASLTACVWAAMAAGLGHMKHFPKNIRILVWTCAAVTAVFYVVHAFWTTIEPRYATVILPLVAALFAAGKDRLKRPLALVGMTALAGFLVFRDLTLVRSLRASLQEAENRMPAQTWEWIKNNLPADAILTKALPAQVYLYTGRSCAGVQVCRSADDYRYELMRQNITHIFTRPARLQKPGIDLGEMWRMNQRWASSDPESYHLLYRNDSENVSLFAVVPSASFYNAYGVYQASMNQIAAGRPEEGLRGLDRALEIDPHLISALNAYAATCLLNGHHLAEAEARLRLAVRLSPAHALAWLNLARVRRALDDLSGARKALLRARASAAQGPEWEGLAPAIEAEMNTIERH